ARSTKSHQRSTSAPRRFRLRGQQRPVERGRFGEGLHAGRGQPVVAARRASIRMRLLLALPGGFHEPVAFELAEGGIHRAARQAGLVDDVEPVLIAAGNRLEHGDGGDTESSHTYSEMLHSLGRVVSENVW